jgi:regulator of sigma E protease
MMAFAQTAVCYVVPFVAIISLIVVVHELGHFLTAKAFGVAIDQFSIGFGRSLVSWRDRSGVEWRVGWLPLGGYVRFAGDENIASAPDHTDLSALRAAIVEQEGSGAELKYLPFKPLWQRTLVVLAGPVANFLLSIVLFASFFWMFGEPVASTRIQQLVAGGAAAHAGFQAGDVIEQADGRTMKSFQDVQFYIQYRAGVPIDFVVRRANQTLHITAAPALAHESSPFGGDQTIGRLGLTAKVGGVRHYDPISALRLGVQRTWRVASTTLFYVGRIVTGQVGADQLHSVLGIAHASGAMTTQAVAAAKSAGSSWIVATAFLLIQMAALMSVSIGLLNLLPIPTLDGGHLLFYAYEAVVRHPPRASIQSAGYRAGLALLVVLMLFATWNDLQRLRVFHLFGSLFS